MLGFVSLTPTYERNKRRGRAILRHPRSINNTMFALALLTVVCMITYSFEIVFGLAGTIMMLPLLSFVYEPKTLVIYSTLPQILAATIGLWRAPKTVDIKFLAGMLAFATLGAGAGLALFYYFSATVFQILLASTVSLFGVVLVIVPRRLRLNAAGARTLDTLAGTSQALFGISGPIAMTRLLATFADKTTVRNYALAFFLALNLLRAGGYLVNGGFTPEIGEMMLVSAPFLIVTLWFASALHVHVNETLFRRTVAWIILGGGISLFFR